MNEEPVKKQKVYQIIYERLKEAILKGEFKVGEKLPPEREMANLFQVSRTSIREALRLLEINGIIEARPGDGTYIRQMEVQALVNELALVIIKSEDNSVFEMLEFRLFIEAECAALAAHRASAADLGRIRKYLEEMAIYQENEELGLLADLNFHYAVAQAANNSILANMMQILGDHMKDSIRTTRRHHLSQTGHNLNASKDHERIYKAVASKEPDQARKLMVGHIMRFRRLMADLPIEFTEIVE